MNFSLHGLGNYRLCFKVDCVSIMFATEREREKESERKSDVRGAETGWESKGKRERGGEREREKPKVRNVQLTPPY